MRVEGVGWAGVRLVDPGEGASSASWAWSLPCPGRDVARVRSVLRGIAGLGLVVTCRAMGFGFLLMVEPRPEREEEQ